MTDDPSPLGEPGAASPGPAPTAANELRPQPSDDRARLAAWLKAALVVAVLLAATLQSPLVGLMLLPLLPVPFALVTLRHGPLGAVSVSAGLAVSGVVVGVSSLGVFMALTCGVLALVLADCVDGGRFEVAPMSALTAAYGVLLAVVALLVAFSGAGTGQLRAQVVDTADRRLSAQAAQCRQGPLDRIEGYCDNVEVQRDAVVGVLRDHALSVLAAVLALTAVASAATSLWVLRVIASPRGLPAPQLGRFSDLRVHWSVAYVLSAGLVLLMLGTMARDSGEHPLFVAGVALTALGASAFVAAGAAVVAFFMARWRVRVLVRVLVWGLLFLTSTLGLGWLLSIGIADALWRLRDRARARDAGV